MRTAYQDSTNGSIHSNSAPVAKGGDAKIEDRTGLFISIVALVLSAIAIGAILIIPRLYEEQIATLKDRVDKAERESRLAAQDAMLLKATVIAHGIPVNEDQLRKDDK